MKKQLLFVLAFATGVSGLYAQSGNVGIGTSTPGSKLTVNGSLAGAYTAVTANTYAAGENDFSIRWSGTADGTITLPASDSGPDRTGRLYFFKNSSTAFILTINANGPELIDFDSTVTIQPGESVLLTKTNNNTASGTTYIVAQLSQTQTAYMYAISATATQSIPQGTSPILDYTTVEYSTNGGSDFNNATNIWTCPQTGWYRIEAFAQATGNGGPAHCGLYVQRNGVAVSGGAGFFYVPNVESNSGSTSRTLNLNQGDQMRIQASVCAGCGATSISVATRRMEITKL
jgi:hypothetical protein